MCKATKPKIKDKKANQIKATVLISAKNFILFCCLFTLIIIIDIDIIIIMISYALFSTYANSVQTVRQGVGGNYNTS